MKFLKSNQSYLPQFDALELEIKKSQYDVQKNSQKQVKDMNFSSQQKNQINSLKIEFQNAKDNQRSTTLQDIIDNIIKTQKKEINKISKFFLQLGFSLSLKPQNISKIKPDRRFISNFIQFVGIMELNYLKSNENLLKNNRFFLKTILYILMLLICGDRFGNKNNELRQKLFQKQLFINNFLKLGIYKHRKISKLYGIVVVYIYKNISVSKVKRQLVESIIHNLKYLDHQKTELNICMILNQLKFQYKLRQITIKEQHLVQKIQKIFIRNQHTYQSVYSLSYLLHFCYEFPNISKIQNNFNQNLKFEITQNIQSFILASNFYQRSLLRYLRFNQSNKNVQQTSSDVFKYLQKISCITNNQSKNNVDSVSPSKLIFFYLKCLQISLQNVQNETQLLLMIQKGLIIDLLRIIKNLTLENQIYSKITNIFTLLVSKLQIRKTMFSVNMSNYITDQIKQFQKNSEQINQRRQNLGKDVNKNYVSAMIQPMQIQ